MNDSMKKILFCITLPEVGGAQKVVYDIIASLDTLKFDVTLATSAEGPLTNWIRKLNEQRSDKIKVVIIPSIKREISLWNDLKALYCIYRIIKNVSFDIVHLHSSKAGALGRCAAWLAGVPKVFYTAHGWGIYESDSKLKQNICGFVERISCHLCTKVVCVSNHDFNKGLARKWIRKEAACVIYNGIENAATLDMHQKAVNKTGEEVLVMGTVMRLKEPKDPIFTIKVFHEVKRMYGNKVKLILIGDGRLMNDCRSLISELDLDDDVEMLGEYEPVRNKLCSFDVFTLFSKSEGLPISIIEAMAAGKPIVASNVGGIPELVIDHISGFLVNGTDINKAAEYISILLKDAELREKMGSYSQEVAHSFFSKDKMMAAYESLYLSEG